MAEVLQLVHLTRKTGVLTVVTEDQVARLFCLSGAIVHAEDPLGQGEEVVFRALGAGGGHFLFDQRPFQTSRTIHDDTIALIMEGLRRLDEMRAAGEEPLPPPQPLPEEWFHKQGVERRSEREVTEGQALHPVLRLNLPSVEKIIDRLEAL